MAKGHPALALLTKICLSFPQASVEYKGRHAAYLVARKTFAYFLNDHHGDKIVAVTCKVLPGDNARLIAADPKRYYMPAYIGPRGWVALRLDVGKVDWEEVAELFRTGYRLTAPKRLLKLQDLGGAG